MIIKLIPELRGSHVHVRMFMGTQRGSLGLAGALVLRPEEWVCYREALVLGAERTAEHVEVVIDDDFTRAAIVDALRKDGS